MSEGLKIINKLTNVPEKALNKIEKFVCEITWGCIPMDMKFVRNSLLFKANMVKYENGEYNELFKQIK
jgi:hypothetical protein